MNKISIEDMEYTVYTIADEHIIFYMIDFNHWDIDDDGFMWTILCHDVKKKNKEEFLLHPADYILERPVLSKARYGITDLGKGKQEMYNTVEAIEDILRRMREARESK